MRIAFSALLCSGVMAGCSGPPSLRVVDYKALSDERLVEYHREVQADLVTSKADWEEASVGGLPVRSQIEKKRVEELEARLRSVELEMRIRRIETPSAPAG